MDKKKTGIICAIIAAIIVIAVIVVCVVRKPAPAPEPTPATEDTKDQDTLSFTGVLTDGGIYSITVEDSKEEKVFDIQNAEFIYKEEGVITIGDTVTVTYIVDKDNKNIAKTVKVDTEVAIVCVEKGIVTDLHDTEVVVVSEQNTTKFTKDKDTVIEGNLSVGDEVEVTYNYNHEEKFHADKIKVTSENKDPEKLVCIGTIAEVTDKQVKIDVNQKKVSYTFKITKDTKITGKATKLEKGQSAAVTYTGHPEKSPDALVVEVTAVPKPAPKPSPTPSPTPTPDPGPVVHGTGIITEWGDKVVVLTEKNKNIELTPADDMVIPAGFFPSKGDMIHFEFGLKNMTITEVQFISRADTMTQGNIVSWSDGKCVITNLTAFTEGATGEDGVNLSQKDIEKNEVEFTISDSIDILDGYMPKQGDCIKFRYMARQDGTYEIVFIRYMGEPEQAPVVTPLSEQGDEPAPETSDEPAEGSAEE